MRLASHDEVTFALPGSCPPTLTAAHTCGRSYLYSMHLKPLTGVKNMVCAAIVAIAIGLGAITMGGGAQSIRAVWGPMTAVGGLIWHREMVMDIKDMDGDAMTGVRTVPVVFGARRALLLSLLPLSAALAAAATAKTGAAALAATAPLAFQGTAALWALMSGFARPAMVAAIELAPLWLLGTLVALCH